MKPKFLKADLDKKIQKAKELERICSLCERRCGIDRNKEKGVCGVEEARISSFFFHYGEEKEIIPSFTIFFSGCNFKCVFCQNYNISQNPRKGDIIEPESMAKIIDQAFRNGAKNVNWVGGDPTPNLVYVLEVLKHVKEPIPVIWNSNFYMTEEVMKILKGVVDIYLPDFKYGNNECGKRFSKVDDYFDIVSRNHKIAKKQGELMIRHLVLPNHFDCCTKPILDWITENLGIVYLNIMDQYRPEYQAKDYKDINRVLKMKEWKQAINYAKKLGFKT